LVGHLQPEPVTSDSTEGFEYNHQAILSWQSSNIVVWEFEYHRDIEWLARFRDEQQNVVYRRFNWSRELAQQYSIEIDSVESIARMLIEEMDIQNSWSLLDGYLI
jgi:hypothetical protein